MNIWRGSLPSPLALILVTHKRNAVETVAHSSHCKLKGLDSIMCGILQYKESTIFALAFLSVSVVLLTTESALATSHI